MSDTQNQAATSEAATQGPVIGIADLQNAVKIIDYACEAGAFKGWSVIEQVIAVRSKLATFLAAAVPPAEPEAPAKPAAKPKAKAPAKKK